MLGEVHENDQGTQFVFKLEDDGEYYDPSSGTPSLTLRRRGDASAQAALGAPEGVTIWTDPEAPSDAVRVRWEMATAYFQGMPGTWQAWVTITYPGSNWTNAKPFEFHVAPAAVVIP